MTLPADAPMVPAAELNRRFYAFVLDRLIAWALVAGAGYLAWAVWFDDGEVWPGVGVIVGTVCVVGLAASLLTGLLGATPGKFAVGLRVVDHDAGRPIGVGRALLRTLILGASTLPTFGLGVATLAWTALTDPSRQRRGWHDRVTRSVVVDVRHQPEPVVEDDEAPLHIVNLTALRLVPADLRPAAAGQPPAPRAEPPPPEPAPWPPRGQARTAPGPAPAQPAAQPGPATQPPPTQPPATQPPVTQPPPAQPAATQAPPTQPPASRPQPAPQRQAPPTPPPPSEVGSGTVARAVPNQPTGYLWRVVFDTGDTMLVAGLGLIGRSPEAHHGEPVKHLVPLPSSDMSLSKTHAQFHLAADGVLVVMDRGSTNGSVLVRQGVARALRPGRPATLLDGDRVRFGDREMRVIREA